MLRQIGKQISRFRVIGLFALLLEQAKKELRTKKAREKYNIHSEASISANDVKLYGDGNITMGENSYLGRNSQILAYPGYSVYIGNNCAIGHYLYVYTVNRVSDQDLSETKKLQNGDVRIEDDVWIGSFVLITEGVSIGENAVIGAQSVVVRDIPPHSVSAGSPAEVKKFKSYIEEHKKKQLAKEYWDSLCEDLQNKYS